MVERQGTTTDPTAKEGGGEVSADSLDDDGKDIRAGRTELTTWRFLRKICQDVGVLYASDNLTRTYTRPDGEIDEAAAKTMAWYQAPERGNLGAHLHIVDPWLIGLRVVGLLGSWVDDLGEISYEALPPHWFEFWQHDRWPLKIRLAFAVAFAEGEGRDQDGRPVANGVWTAYVRPLLPDDPADAPTRFEPHMGTSGAEVDSTTGRYIRWEAGGTQDSPWPIPPVGDSSIIEDEPNPLVMAGGFAEGRRVWQPIIVHTAEPLTEGLRLPIADDLANINSELDQGITEAFHTANLQLKGIPVFTGPDNTPNKIGPLNPVRMPTVDSSFRYESPAGKPAEHLDVMHRGITIGALLSNLSVDSVSLKPPSITTGPAMRLRRADLITDRNRRIVDANRPEARRFDLERVLHNAHGVTATRKAIPWDVEQTTNWGELTTPIDWNTRLDEMAKEEKLGITTKEENMAERHRISLVEAQRRIKAAEEASTSEDVDAEAAFTGVQTTSEIAVVVAVATGQMPPESGIEILVQSYPFDRETATAIIAGAGTTFHATPKTGNTNTPLGPGLADSQTGSDKPASGGR